MEGTNAKSNTYEIGRQAHEHDILLLIDHGDDLDALRKHPWSRGVIEKLQRLLAVQEKDLTNEIYGLLEEALRRMVSEAHDRSPMKYRIGVPHCVCSYCKAFWWWTYHIRFPRPTWDGAGLARELCVPVRTLRGNAQYSRVMLHKVSEELGIKGSLSIYSEIGMAHWDSLERCFDAVLDQRVAPALRRFESGLAHLLNLERRESPGPTEYALTYLALVDGMQPPSRFFLFEQDGFILRGLALEGRRGHLHHSVVDSTTRLMVEGSDVLDRLSGPSTHSRAFGGRAGTDEGLDLQLSDGLLVVSHAHGETSCHLQVDPGLQVYLQRFIEVRAWGRENNAGDTQCLSDSGYPMIEAPPIIGVDDNEDKLEQQRRMAREYGLDLRGCTSIEEAAHERSLCDEHASVTWLIDQGGVVVGGRVKTLGIRTTACTNSTSPSETLQVEKAIARTYPHDRMVHVTRLFQGPSLDQADRLGFDHACYREISFNVLGEQLRQQALGHGRPNFTTPLPQAVMRFMERASGETPLIDPPLSRERLAA